ncbi:Unknown protein [Striga hermonthica]|uniref:Zinc knuckle CX2CX4HX4C domain-containing protein n=1 Tax=Striga hermonthica TaxID=68872 RepID=A0A9N7MSX9_STRHE|nr:Unknown protein [Striga hermonthica]
MEQEFIEKLHKFQLSNKEKMGVTLDQQDVETGIQECELSLIGKIIEEKKVNLGRHAKDSKREEWLFDGQYLLLKEWISAEAGMKVGRIFGKVIDVVVPVVGNVNGRIVRILVEVSVTDPLPRRTTIKLGAEERWIDFKYENLLTFCFYCGVIGHNDRACETKRDKPVSDASIEREESGGVGIGRSGQLSNVVLSQDHGDPLDKP